MTNHVIFGSVQSTFSTHPHVEGLGLLLSTLAHARLDSLALGGKPQCVTAVDKPINMPRISRQACTERSMQLAVSNRWTGLLEWTTGMDFDLFSFFSPRA